ncbi:MAG TPA: SRPBCC family protein [Thermoanaerobaculia bacterium]|nr:SRPBCC family protein [Thermoanaerobaculia bacterium]
MSADREIDREIRATRVFDAPRELVWKVWTDPVHIAQWWGPNGFTNTISEMEVKPGGVWRFIMHGPDGTDYPNEITYLEVEKPSRLVYDHGPVPRFRVTVTFEEEGGRTRLTMRSLFETAEEREKVVEEYGAIEGLNQTLGRLAEHLARPEVNITRTFEEKAS